MEYLLIKEHCITNGRYVHIGAIRWPGSPVPILDRQTWETVGSLTSLRRKGNWIYGVTEDFDRDVDLAIEITNIQSATKDNILYITSGILRAAIIEEKR